MKMTSAFERLLFLMLIFFCANLSMAQKKRSSTLPVIIGRVDFDNHKIDNNYSPFDLQADFGTMLSLGTFIPSARVKIIDTKTKRGKVIRVKYPRKKLGSYASGASWRWSNFGKHEDLYLSFWVKFEKNFQFRAGGKLHGLCGGACNTGGKKPNGHDGWSSRVHWGPGNTLKNYVYHKDQRGRYGQVFFWSYQPQKILIKTGKSIPKINPAEQIKIHPDVWYHITTRVKVNTIGKKNGIVQSWLNGRLVLDVRGFEFRDKTCKDDELLIDTMYFSTFFGGNSPPYQPVKDEYIYFDEFVLSKSPVIPEVFQQK